MQLAGMPAHRRRPQPLAPLMRFLLVDKVEEVIPGESIRRACVGPNDLGEFEFRADPSGDGLTLSGYIAKFGEKSVIQDWLGEYVEEIKREGRRRLAAERAKNQSDAA